MKAFIQKKPLLEGLDLVKDAVSKHVTLPILKNVKINAEGEGLYLYATNLNTGIKAWVREANVIEPGTALCDALKLLSIVRELPDTDIILSTEENNHVRVECDHVSFKLIGLGVEDYPAEISPIEPDTHPIGEDFFKALLKVRHAASREESRYNLNGVYLNGEIVATDGHRLSLARTSHPMEDALVPLEFINTILRSRRNGDQNFTLSRSESTIFFYSEDLIISSRLIDGSFPDYKRVIPETHERAATMNRLRLYHAIKRILLMSDKSNQIRFEFNGDRALLTSANPDAGEAREELEARYTSNPSDGSPFVIGFAGKYLLDVLEVLESDQVTFLMNQPDQPMKIEESDSLHIIMPVRLIESSHQEEKKAA